MITMSIKKITEEEVRSLWVQRLSDTPNRHGRFGTMGLSAAEMKAAYDALPLRIVQAYNALVDAIESGLIAEAIPTAVEKMSLGDLLNGIRDGSLAACLTVDGERTLSALAAALDTHDHSGVYARLGADGHLLPEQLPIGHESVFAEAERKRAEAEAKREAAEAERQRALPVIQDRIDGLEEREAGRDRTDSDREARIQEQGERLAMIEEGGTLLDRRVVSLEYSVKNLEAAGLGVTHIFYTDATVAHRKTIPERILPYATLSRLGGAAAVGKRVAVSAVVSCGANLLAYPYPAVKAAETTTDGVTFRQMSDGSILMNGTATRNMSYHLYTEHDGLALPESGVYVDSQVASGVTLYVKSGSYGAVWKTERFIPSPSDEYYGSYAAYLYITAGTVLNNLRVYPTIAIGTEARHAIPYKKPCRIEIPEAVRSLPGYGWYENLLDLESGCYRQRRTEDGIGMNAEVLHPLPEDFLSSLVFPVTAGGYIELENEQSAAVESEIKYLMKTS